MGGEPVRVDDDRFDQVFDQYASFLGRSGGPEPVEVEPCEQGYRRPRTVVGVRPVPRAAPRLPLFLLQCSKLSGEAVLFRGEVHGRDRVGLVDIEKLAQLLLERSDGSCAIPLGSLLRFGLCPVNPVRRQ